MNFLQIPYILIPDSIARIQFGKTLQWKNIASNELQSDVVENAQSSFSEIDSQ